MSHLLDNPIWNALTTHQRRFAERDGDAARFAPDVTLLAGMAAPTDEAFAAVARLVPEGQRAGLFLDASVAIPPVLHVLDGDDLVQMYCAGGAPETVDDAEIVELGAADTAEMMALAELTRPGPFGARTRELGSFVGIRLGGRLAAMAGQRMRLDGLVEVSAVCTHPDFLGRRLAERLMRAQLAHIAAAGDTAFLHVRAGNTRAIALYQRVGFAERRRLRYAVVCAAAGRGAIARSAP